MSPEAGDTHISRVEQADYWIRRGDVTLPRHLLGVYQQGRMSAEQLSAIGDLFADQDDFEEVMGGGAYGDARYFTATLRLMDLVYKGYTDLENQTDL